MCGAEVALSHFDKNRLSSLSDGDNAGTAATVGVQHVFDFEKKETKNQKPKTKNLPWQLELNADYEFTQQRFKELNPYRPAEFTRDWNVNTGANDVGITTRPSNEHLASTGFILRSPKSGSLQYKFGGFFRDSVYTGTKHFSKYAFQKNGFDIWVQGDLLTTDGIGNTGNDNGERSEFFRPKVNIAVPLFRDSTGKKYWRGGVYGERERNSRFTKITNGIDTLNRASFYYDIARIYLESPDYERFGIKTSYQRRFDYAPVGSRFSSSTIADEFNLQGKLGTKPQQPPKLEFHL